VTPEQAAEILLVQATEEAQPEAVRPEACMSADCACLPASGKAFPGFLWRLEGLKNLSE